MRRTLLSLGIGLAVSGLTLWIILITMDTGPIWAVLITASPVLFLCSLLVAATTQALRAWRLSVLLGHPISLPLVGLVARHQFWANLLPFRAGEAALPVFLKISYKIPLVQGAMMLLVLRVYDLGMIVALGGVVAGVMLWSAPWFAPAAPWVLTLGVCATMCLFIAPWIAQGFLSLPWLQKIKSLLEGLTALTPSHQRRLVWTTLWVWVSVLAAYALAFQAVGISLTAAEAIISGAAGALAFALPINGLAGVGPFEAAITATLSSLGYDASLSLSAAIAAHITVFLATALQALISAFWMGPHRHDQTPPEDHAPSDRSSE